MSGLDTSSLSPHLSAHLRADMTRRARRLEREEAAQQRRRARERELTTKPGGADPELYARGSRPSEGALAERDARLAVAPRDLTAALLGDPKPGFSALDRRHKAEVTR
jgi:hypothetical protein